jgi:hypothetical protein
VVESICERRGRKVTLQCQYIKNIRVQLKGNRNGILPMFFHEWAPPGLSTKYLNLTLRKYRVSVFCFFEFEYL